jgi:preprotein translocase subunit YajC
MIGKLFAGFAAAGVMAAVLATGVMAAPATTAAGSPTTKTRPAAKDVFGGTVTAINDTQLTVKNAKAGSKTFLRQDSTVVVTGRNDKSSWSAIEVNSHVLVRFQERNGELYATRIHLGPARLAGRVESVSDTSITIRTRDGKDVRLTVSSSTKYFEIVAKGQRKAGSLADIHAGMRIAAAGSYDASHNFDAAIVAYRNK